MNLRLLKMAKSWVRSPAVGLGYLHGDRVQSAVDNDGWLHTGDLGKLDPMGQLYVLGRQG